MVELRSRSALPLLLCALFAPLAALADGAQAPQGSQDSPGSKDEPPPPLPGIAEQRIGSRELSEIQPVEKDGALVCPEGSEQAIDKQGQPVFDDKAPVCRPRREFVKGELTNLGSSKLLVKDSRFGLRLGAAYLEHTLYAAISPELDLRWDKFAFGLGLPLHVDALYAYDGGGIRFRKHDYDSASDYAKIIRFITYGAKEDNVYLNISQLFAATIGHGAIVRRYSGNTDQNITRVGAQLDAYNNFGGFEAFIGDIVQPTHFMSGLVFLKPLGFFGMKGDAANTWGQTSLGLSVGADVDAPLTLSRDAAGRPETDDKGAPVVARTQSAVIAGLDLETKIVKTDKVDIKPYLDYSRLLSSATLDDGRHVNGGGGFTAGLLGRFNAGGEKVHAFRVVLEGRYYDGNYLPGYFDTFYEVQKYQFITGPASASYNPKLLQVLSQDPSSKRAGFYAEAAWQYNGGFAVMAAVEGATTTTGSVSGVGGRNFTFHVEYPAYSFLQFFGSFYRRSFGGSIFPSQDANGSYPDDMLIYAAARLHILPILFLNGRYYRTWQTDPALGQMHSLNGFEIDLELGYEFDRKR